jgi:hypothetical protein
LNLFRFIILRVCPELSTWIKIIFKEKLNEIFY